MSKPNVLLVGETWVTVSRHIKGFDHFTETSYHDGAGPFKRTLRGEGLEIDHMTSDEAPGDFPVEAADLEPYDVVILSDIGANSLTLPPETFHQGQRSPNRLKLLRDWVEDGGGFVMVGGYLSFQGIYGRAAYKDTPIEKVLPVGILSYDDRAEHPEGVEPEPGEDFEKLPGLPEKLPHVLGYNRTRPRSDASVIYEHGSDPILATRKYGQGRSAVWTPDMGPHWCPEDFLQAEAYTDLWTRLLEWVAG